MMMHNVKVGLVSLGCPKNKVDAETFFNHYESANWFRGKTKIVNWKSCVITWEKNDGYNRGNNKKSGFRDARKKGTDWLS